MKLEMYGVSVECPADADFERVAALARAFDRALSEDHAPEHQQRSPARLAFSAPETR